ncbi:RNase H domain-containing protein [Colletotrichum fioriniae PJ7]|uniref:RNase H domain-containing protein n=1 Tax=Colletotrichum fioriniae PJ7 TaxID=1445577 RepID=A0A010RJ07_9PEZI|nr:RNase H domain-containing protein [Colletotrichum fioriniae PJ7]
MRRPRDGTRFIIRCLEHQEIECVDCPQPRDTHAAEYLRSLRPMPRPPREGPSDIDLTRARRPIYFFYSGRRPDLGDPYVSNHNDDALSDIEGELDYPMSDDDSSDWSLGSCPGLSDGSSADHECSPKMQISPILDCPSIQYPEFEYPERPYQSANGRLATRFVNIHDQTDFLIYIQGLCRPETRTGSWAYLFKPYHLGGAVTGRLERLGPYGDLRTPVRHRAELRAALAALTIPADFRHGFKSLTIATTRTWLVEDGELLVEQAWDEMSEAGSNPLLGWAEARHTPEFAHVSDGDLWFAMKRQIQTLYSIDDPENAVTVQFRLIDFEFNRDCQGEALGALDNPRRPYRFREPKPKQEL